MLDFHLFGRRSRPLLSKKNFENQKGVRWESLENRQLLSVSPFADGGGPHGFGGGGQFGPGGEGPGDTIEFSQAPTAVQTGLDKLASTDAVTAPAATSTIRLGNADDVETYSYDATGTGTESVLTVDENGNPVTAPTHTTTTFGAITNTAVTNEINAIATALELTAATSATSVDVVTASDSSVVYSIALAPAGTTTTAGFHRPLNALISVDGDGNPVGHEQVPLSVLSTTIQTGLTKNAPTGAMAPADTSLIDVDTIEGTTLYTAHYISTGTETTVTVNAAGTLTSLPSIVQSTFGEIPTAAQTELQALATADGYTGTIAATLAVTESIEVNGAIIYTIHLPITSDSSTQDATITLSVDAQGNPTVPPGISPGFGGFSGEGNLGGMNCGQGDGDGSGSGGTGDSGSTNSSGGSSSLSVGAGDGSTTAASTVAATSSTIAASTTPTTTPVLTKAEERAAANALAKATRLAKQEAAKAAREAAAAARKAARLAAEAAKKAAE